MGRKATERLAELLRLGEAIRSARSELGLSQEQCARRAGLDRSYYSALERGEFNPTMDTLWRVGEGLGVPIGQVLLRAGL
jgi:transcriptional regulator with XRE-family HTH domain